MSHRVLDGKVVSDKMHKTVVVSVEMPKKHPVYTKSIRNTRKFKARNDANAKVGDYVFIEETKPYSKHVSWKVAKVVKEGKK